MSEWTRYQKLFGAGPRGTILSMVLFLLVWWQEETLGLPAILDNENLRLLLSGVSIVLTIVIVAWSLKSLPPSARGERLVQEGAFAVFLHPLYGAFLSCFNFGLAVFMNNYVYVIWAILLHPLWHWNIRYEENLMTAQFGDAYTQYRRTVSRFFPLKFLVSLLKIK